MTTTDLHTELNDKIILLDRTIEALKGRGRKFAQAENDYRVALAEKMLVERTNGIPATILGDVCRGDRTIAKLKFERDCAETLYKAALEAINSFKLQIRVIEAQIQREFTS